MPNRMNRGRAMAAAAIATMIVAGHARDAAAQQVEVQPFVGARWGGGFTVSETIPGGSRPVELNPDAGLVWGGTASISAGPMIALEFMYSRQETSLTAEPLGLPESELFDASYTQYHGNVLFHFLAPDRHVRPYILFGAGSTTIAPDGDIESLTKFSYSVGGGIKAYFNDHVGVRLQGRVTPTYVSSSPAVFCDLFGFCYVGEEANYLTQGEVTVGVTIRF